MITSKLVEVQVLITELPTLVEQKSKQTDIDDRTELMSSPINNPAIFRKDFNPILKVKFLLVNAQQNAKLTK